MKALRSKRRPRLLEKAVSMLWPTNPTAAIMRFKNGFVAEYRGLQCNVGREDDGTWELTFNIDIATRLWYCGLLTQRKVPSSTLQAKLLEIVGIETKLEGHPIYPSLVGRVPNRPDPRELLGKMKALMRSVDVKLLYTEPDDDEAEEA